MLMRPRVHRSRRHQHVRLVSWSRDPDWDAGVFDVKTGDKAGEPDLVSVIVQHYILELW